MPPSLGQRLKKAREEQGLSLADLSHRTRIPVPRLQDLEHDHYHAFGSLTYTRSFLQTYARLLGVNANCVTDHMQPTPLGGERDYHYLTANLGRWVGQGVRTGMMPETRSLQFSKLGSAVAAVLAISLLGSMLWAKAYLTQHSAVTHSPRTANRELPTTVRANSQQEILASASGHPSGSVPVRKALPLESDPKVVLRK